MSIFLIKKYRSINGRHCKYHVKRIDFFFQMKDNYLCPYYDECLPVIDTLSVSIKCCVELLIRRFVDKQCRWIVCLWVTSIWNRKVCRQGMCTPPRRLIPPLGVRACHTLNTVHAFCIGFMRLMYVIFIFHRSQPPLHRSKREASTEH